MRGGERDEGGWFRGLAAAKLKLKGTQLQDEQLVAAQVCKVADGVARCGCRDRACSEALWQLQAFRRPLADVPEPDPPLNRLPEPPPAAEPPAIEPPPAEPPPVEPPGGTADGPGATVFNRCSPCHVADQPHNRIGPHLVGIFGRTAGTVESYNYSAALAESGIVWNDQALADFLANPRGFVPGTKMAFSGLDDEQDIRDLLHYLRAVAGSS